MTEVKNITDILKDQGLDIAEDVAIATVKGVIKALPGILALTPNKFDDLLIPILGLVEAPLISLLDKIDGKVDAQ
jgi:hypothetical protein